MGHLWVLMALKNSKGMNSKGISVRLENDFLWWGIKLNFIFPLKWKKSVVSILYRDRKNARHEFVHSISRSTAPPLNYSVPKCEVIVNKFNGKRFIMLNIVFSDMRKYLHLKPSWTEIYSELIRIYILYPVPVFA